MIPNPAIEAFVGAIGAEKVWGQILIQPSQSGFTIRHVADRSVPAEQLKRIGLSDARKLAMFTEAGQFRPLRAAPDLPGVGSLIARIGRPLARFAGILSRLSCGLVCGPKRFAPTDYREFTARQSGMYRITQLLTDEQAANVTRATCHPRFCLKQRLWTVPGLELIHPGQSPKFPASSPARSCSSSRGKRVESNRKRN